MYLIAGLGNPGAKYQQTRHNIGFMFLDHLVGRLSLTFSDSKWQANTCKGMVQGRQAVFVKPQTYMNNSGVAVAQVAAYFKIPPEKIMVVHDELDLSPGRAKMVYSRGAGGHNGISSIVSHLGSKDISRIRIGIGRPESPAIKVSNYVLGKFTADELRDSELLYGDIERAIEMFVEQGAPAAMNFINSIK